MGTTQKIEAAIVLSDAYNGNSDTSVTELIGAVGKPIYIMYFPERKTYEINLETGSRQEVKMEFYRYDVFSHGAGFDRDSQWMLYCCAEDAFNSGWGLWRESVEIRIKQTVLIGYCLQKVRD